jgi:serine/threonine protein kinase
LATLDQLDIGVVLHDTYELTGQLGAGGMGVVWKARHLRLPKQVAIKVLRGIDATEGDAYARFRREADIISGLSHPNIVDATDFNTLDDGSPYLVLELLRGRSLRQRLQAGDFATDEVIRLVEQLGAGLSAAHRQGVVHRDLKPENVFLCEAEDLWLVKILDFGISKIRGTQTLTKDDMLIGTPHYMAPEQAKGEDADARSDQFALAAMTYEMLAGRPPFHAEQPLQVLYQIVHQDVVPVTKLRPDCPLLLAQTVERALSKPPAERFESVATFVDALRSAIGAAPAGLTPPPSSALQSSSSSSDMQLAKTMTPEQMERVSLDSSEIASAPTVSQRLTPAGGGVDLAAETLEDAAAETRQSNSTPQVTGPLEQDQTQVRFELKASASNARWIGPVLATIVLVAVAVIVSVKSGNRGSHADQGGGSKSRSQRAMRADDAAARVGQTERVAERDAAIDSAIAIRDGTSAADGATAREAGQADASASRLDARTAKKSRHNQKPRPRNSSALSGSSKKRFAALKKQILRAAKAGQGRELERLRFTSRQLLGELSGSRKVHAHYLLALIGCGLQSLATAKDNYRRLRGRYRVHVRRLCKEYEVYLGP